MHRGTADAAGHRALHHRGAGLGTQPVRNVSDGDHHRACVLGAHAFEFEFEQIGSEFLDQRDDDGMLTESEYRSWCND